LSSCSCAKRQTNVAQHRKEDKTRILYEANAFLKQKDKYVALAKGARLVGANRAFARISRVRFAAQPIGKTRAIPAAYGHPLQK